MDSRWSGRIDLTLRDYKYLEDTFESFQINGRPAFRSTASFTSGGKKHLEYFIRVLGRDMMAMFFVPGPVEEMDIVRQEVDQMAATIQVP